MNYKKVIFAVVLFAAVVQLQAQEHELWYDKPASHWLEALPVGNSHLGAMIYGGTDVEEIQLNEETFGAGSPRHCYCCGASLPRMSPR
ncbi:glycoside hydrolase N-terminal domain-containing protein, partial [Parabacteroides distasonis]